jgi:tRNA(Arg) A34 adenosine deaminase TadA
MYTTLSPCDMCTGACILYKIPRVVLGENKTFLGGEAYLKQRGVEVVNVKSKADERVHSQAAGGLVSCFEGDSFD